MSKKSLTGISNPIAHHASHLGNDILNQKKDDMNASLHIQKITDAERISIAQPGFLFLILASVSVRYIPLAVFDSTPPAP